MQATAELGLRERKKVRTRTLIVETADELFLEHGYENVTLNEVADACEVSVRTVLRYFETKEALALSHEYADLERFRKGLEEHPGEVLEFWRSHVAAGAAALAERPDWFRRRYDAIRRQPALHARYVGIQRSYEEALAQAIAEERPQADRFAPALLAGILCSGTEFVVRDWLRGRRRFDPDAIIAAVDYATGLFNGRLGPKRSERDRRSRRKA